MSILLLALSLLPVVLLLVFIYRQDKYEKEPIWMLVKAFIGGILCIPLDLFLVNAIHYVFYAESVFYSAFIEAGFCEELSKFIILFLAIWWNKNFNEYMDGIVYAAFVGLGFACVENILYVFQAGYESFGAGISTGVVRALLSVPGHFLFAVIMGYFFSMAKFSTKGRFGFLLLGFLCPALAHGLFDWLLMINEVIDPLFGTIIFVIFLWGDIKLWKLGVKYIRKHQENSQFKESTKLGSLIDEYKHIDWNAGDKR
ncbi:MAG: PrsW family intramembrane metalloprotease [Bacteroidales bacterium]|nr:PrsW family intramembrane metalloprotease [Bacteroidales bacterium]